MDIKTFRKGYEVFQSVQLTPENFWEVADWCRGNNTHASKKGVNIVVGTRGNKAYIAELGDWVARYMDGFEVYDSEFIETCALFEEDSEEKKGPRYQALFDLVKEAVAWGNDRGGMSSAEADVFVSKIYDLTGGPRFTQEETPVLSGKVVVMTATIENGSESDILAVLRGMREASDE